MIDIASETILTLSEAAERLPRRRNGRSTHVSTLYRWTVSGCRGVVLEHTQIGATRATSLEALQRFFDRLTRGDEGATTLPLSRSLVQRQRRSEAAARELERIGA
jgi:Protein of unknown function (DUF1580)